MLYFFEKILYYFYIKPLKKQNVGINWYLKLYKPFIKAAFLVFGLLIAYFVCSEVPEIKQMVENGIRSGQQMVDNYGWKATFVMVFTVVGFVITFVTQK